MSTIKISSHDGDHFDAYIAKAKDTDTAPTIVVLQEIFGVNHVMRDICDDLAEKGFNAIAPDLFWRMERNVDITDKTEAEWQQAFDYLTRLDLDLSVKDINSAVEQAKDIGSGKVGTVGYCLGGRLAYLAATRTNVDASVGYYGVTIENYLNEASNIGKPLTLHIAGLDEYCSPEAQKQIHDALDTHPKVSLFDYPKNDHAFARVGGQHYDQVAADLANQRSLDFFNQHLK